MLSEAEVIVGYRTYIDLIQPLIGDKPVISTGMTQEVHRVEAALDEALAGRRVALVSSGDPGIYAMAGLALELCAARNVKAAPAWGEGGGLTIEVVPGIPALCAGAALIGAPLTHDFAAISLSDLLTPWETIEKRLAAAAQADFVIVIYNPKSKKRDWQLPKAQQIILGHRAGSTPVGIVTGAMRPEQGIALTTLDQLHGAAVDMQTTVFIGNSTTRRWGDFIFTPRGYGHKYTINGRIR
ncbi:MAG: precorrin-3B C(17)-methyltransferase [Desulfatitalea sp.]